jgi:hypothetical protein
MTRRSTNFARVSDSPFEGDPAAYAKHLATYMRDPSKIRAHTRNFFGRAPSTDIIRAMIAEAMAPVPERRDMAEDRDWPDDDGEPWRPRGLVKLETDDGLIQRMHAKLDLDNVVFFCPPARLITATEHVKAISADYGVFHDDVIGRSRFGILIRPRMTAAHVLSQRGFSYARIGQFLGGRDHSTIAHLTKRFAEKATPADHAIAAKYYKPEAAGVVE